ncbi:MAG: hypothetical protein Q8L56_08530 [Rhodocyclaceae bacterium]|nr:hypothetical protein [Rhodocyclaceae bacterium]
MDLKAVYKKTQKGQEEMAQRTVLGMRERTLLVMVDGKITAADLLAKAQHMPDPQGLLGKLIEGGFIAAEAVAAPVAATSTAPPPAPTAVTPQEQRIMQETLRYAEHFLDAALGQDSETLTLALAKSKTIAEFRTRLEKTRDVLEGMGKKRKAEEFWAAAQSLIEGKSLPAPAQSPAAPAPAAAPMPPPAAPVPPPPSAAPQPSMQEAVHYARRFLNDALGPEADTLVEAIEKCKTLPDLRARLEKTREALERIGSKRKAEAFWAGVEPRLPHA